jgi:hypothetical protein
MDSAIELAYLRAKLASIEAENRRINEECEKLICQEREMYKRQMMEEQKSMHMSEMRMERIAPHDKKKKLEAEAEAELKRKPGL